MINEADKEKVLKPALSRRADKRICFEPPINALIKAKDHIADAVLTDISCSGLRFYSKEQYTKGKKVLFEIQSDKKVELPGKIKAKIKNEYGTTEDGKYIYGAKFFRISYWYERNRIHAYVYSENKKETPR